jgi:NitT/TauT family transport system permease protein
MAVSAQDLKSELAGLDALEQDVSEKGSLWQRLWPRLWPKVAALVIVIGLWQLVVLSGWKEQFVLPGPAAVGKELLNIITTGKFWEAVARTARRAGWGYGISLVIGVTIGGLVAMFKPMRSAVGALITGLQTMPSIVWFPPAVLLFKLSESAIAFVVIMGAAPAIANGLISGVDHVSPILVRAGRVLGARGFGLFRYVVLPAALPSFLGGLKQAWAFAWRSLMAAELLATSLGHSIGADLQNARDLSDAKGMYAMMIVLLIIGLAVDSAFGAADNRLRRRYGLIDLAAK